MLISRDWIVCALLAAAVSLEAGSARAGAFDFRTQGNRQAGRAQSPEMGHSASSEALHPVSQTPAVTYESSTIAGWGYDSSPCFNCGEFDHYQRRVRWCRDKICKETWYPRVAPYCQPSWGYTQPCWRRVADNYNCVRPDYRGSVPKPRRARAVPALPAEEPPALPEPPELPTSSRPSPAVRAASQTASYAQPPAASYAQPPVARPEAPVIERRPDPSRFTSVAETIDSDMEDEELEEAGLDDTLEAQSETAEDDPEADDESDSAMIDE